MRRTTPITASTLPSRYIRTDLLHRSIMQEAEVHRIGIGFLDKSGWSTDVTDWRTVFWSVQLVLRGSGTYRDDRGVQERLIPGSIFQRLPDRIHTTTIDPATGYAECFLFLDPSLWNTGVSLGLLDPHTPVRHGAINLAVVRQVDALMERMRQAPSRSLGDLALEVMQLGARLLRLGPGSADPDQDLIERLCERLAADPAGRWPLTELARGCGLSWERLRKLFAARTGCSPQTWRLQRRMDRARELLLGSDAHLAAIADELGYPSAFAFSAQFKQQMGVSPTKYRGGRVG
jgi:AraC family transcriptional regulator of arabinose operon